MYSLNHFLVLTMDIVQSELLCGGGDYVQPEPCTSCYWLCTLYSLNPEVGSGFGSRSDQVKSSEFNLIHNRIHNTAEDAEPVYSSNLPMYIYLPLSIAYHIKCLSYELWNLKMYG
jgi:hypothetical protein